MEATAAITRVGDSSAMTAGSLFSTLLGEAHHPSVAVTIFFGLILVALVACLALEEQLHAKKSLIAGLFAVVCLLLGTFTGILSFEKIVVGSHEVDVEELDDGTKQELMELADEGGEDSEEAGEHEFFADGHQISMPVYIPGIDWSVIAIILGSSLFVDVTSKSGLFTWIAIRVTKASGGDPLKLLMAYGVMTVVFSAVLNNVTAMIIVGSLTAVSLDKLKRSHQLLGFLLVEGLLTNVGGLLTLISSVPNIIVGTTAGISFLSFFIKAAPFVVVATAATLVMGARWFKIGSLRTEQERASSAELVKSFDERDGIESEGFFWFATGMLALFILTIATTSALPGISNLGMGFVALAFAAIMLIRYRHEVDRFYKAVDWDLLGFFMALFVVIYVMEHAGVLHAIGGGLQAVLSSLDQPPEPGSGTNPMDASILLVGSAVFSSVTDNIPLAAMLASILASFSTPSDSGLWWAVVFGANLGGNITPIGSASTLVAVTIMHKHKLGISFAGFVKAAVPFAAVQLVLAVLYLLLVLPFLPG